MKTTILLLILSTPLFGQNVISTTRQLIEGPQYICGNNTIETTYYLMETIITENVTGGQDTATSKRLLSVDGRCPADSISIAAGLITNDRSTTVTWLVHYDFTYNSDEDPCYSFFDLTTDGSEVPAAIAGSSAYSNQVSVLGTQHPGRSFLVNVPSGQAIRLCVKGNILAATEMNISYLTISIEEK